MGYGAAISAARSRSDLRQRLRRPGKGKGYQTRLSAPRSPWQRAYVERVIGTIRRECLDHMIVFNEHCLYRHLQKFINYYHRSRTHLVLERDSPEPPDPTASVRADHRNSAYGRVASSLPTPRRL